MDLDAPCLACSRSLLTAGGETKPPGVTEVRARREREAKREREAAVPGCPELPAGLSLSSAGAGLGWHAGDVTEQDNFYILIFQGLARGDAEPCPWWAPGRVQMTQPCACTPLVPKIMNRARTKVAFPKPARPCTLLFPSKSFRTGMG